MGIKFTGFSTPFGGISWEYIEKKKKMSMKLFSYFL